MPTKTFLKVFKKCVQQSNMRKLDDFLNTVQASDVFTRVVLKMLTNLLKRNGQYNEKMTQVSCVLVCLKNLKDNSLSLSQWETLANDLGKLCNLVWSIACFYIKDETIMQSCLTVLESLIDHNHTVTNALIRHTFKQLLKFASGNSNSIQLRLLTLISSMMKLSSRDVRKTLIRSSKYYLCKLSNCLSEIGDYETQVALVEVLARSVNFLETSDLEESNLFSNFPNIVEIFNSYSFLNFDLDCRLFLNMFNNGLEKQLVYSIPCLSITIGGTEYIKPYGLSNSKFWVDFNVSSKTISFYYQINRCPDSPWCLKMISERHVIMAESQNSQVLTDEGETIDGIEIILWLNQQDTNEEIEILKIYLRRCQEFEKLNPAGITAVLEYKYKNSILLLNQNSSNDKQETAMAHRNSKESELMDEDIEQSLTLEWFDEVNSQELMVVRTPDNQNMDTQEDKFTDIIDIDPESLEVRIQRSKAISLAVSINENTLITHVPLKCSNLANQLKTNWLNFKHTHSTPMPNNNTENMISDKFNELDYDQLVPATVITKELPHHKHGSSSIVDYSEYQLSQFTIRRLDSSCFVDHLNDEINLSPLQSINFTPKPNEFSSTTSRRSTQSVTRQENPRKRVYGEIISPKKSAKSRYLKQNAEKHKTEQSYKDDVGRNKQLTS